MDIMYMQYMQYICTFISFVNVSGNDNCTWLKNILANFAWHSISFMLFDPSRSTVVMSMFVLSKWQRVALPMRWHASVRALFYYYLTFLDPRTNISRKVGVPRHVSASGAPNKFQNCHLGKQTWTKHHNTLIQAQAGRFSECSPAIQQSWWVKKIVILTEIYILPIIFLSKKIFFDIHCCFIQETWR